METIETIISPLQQRAIEFAGRRLSPKMSKQSMIICYMNGAEEQDKIARAEERERCINAAQKYICNTFCKALELASGSQGICEWCKAKGKLRKAIEEGDKA